MFDLCRSVALAKIVTLLVSGGLALLCFTPVWAQTPDPNANHIGLVVVHGDGQVLTRCVGFNENEINGYDLLARSGLDLNIEVGGNGAAICRIDNEGCTYPQDDCFCQCTGGACTYWSYWQWAGTSWQYASLGASNMIGHNGDVQGWHWGLGRVDSATAPPAIAFNDICKLQTPAQATATTTATPTVTPIATATATGTSTPTPSTTVTATASPTTAPATPQPTSSATATPIPLPSVNTPTATAPATVPPTPITTSAPATVANAPTPVPAPGILEFSATPLTITTGAGTVLTWRLVNAETAVLRTNNGEEPIVTGKANWVGSKAITPPQTTVYTLVVRSSGGEASAQLTITVNAPVRTPTQPITVSMASVPAQPVAAPPPTPTTLPVMVVASPLVTPPATLAPLRFDLTPPTAALTTVQAQSADADPVQAQNLLLFGALALVLIVPVGIAGLGLLIWAIWRQL